MEEKKRPKPAAAWEFGAIANESGVRSKHLPNNYLR
jgi:hypothetical protein